jgi:membrane protein YqaA with SNARE-associated domain
MFEWLEGFLLNYGYVGLFISSFLASTILPFGSEGIVVLLVSQGFNAMAVVMVASTGNFFGACTRIEKPDLEKAEKYFSKYGSYVLLFTWVPLIGDAITVTGGLLRLKFTTFAILVFVGKFLRYLAVAYLTGLILL